MKTISASSLRAQLTDVIAALDSGPVTITKHGKPIEVHTSPHAPVDTGVAPRTATDSSGPSEPVTSPPEPVKAVPSEDEEEGDDWGDNLDEEFESYLSENEPEYDLPW